MKSKYQQAKDAIQAKRASLFARLDLVTAEATKALNGGNDAAYEKAKSDMTEIRGQIDTLEAENTANETAAAEYMRKHGRLIDTQAEPHSGVPRGYGMDDDRSGQLRTIGEAITTDPVFRDFVGNTSRAGGVRLVLRDVALTALALQRAAGDPMLLPATNMPASYGGIVGALPRRTRIRDLLPFGGFDAPFSMAYASESSKEGGASKHAEAALIDSVHFVLSQKTWTMQTLASISSVSMQILRYNAGASRWMNQRMINDLLDVEDGYFLSDGTVGLATLATAFTPTASEAAWQSIRRAIGAIESASDTPTGIVLNPADYALMDIAVDDENRPILAGAPSEASPRTIFSVPVATSLAMPSGHFLAMGASAAEWFSGRDIQVELNGYASEYWKYGLVGIRCLEDIALAVYRPTSLRYGLLVA